jgi:hypothetical protein
MHQQRVLRGHCRGIDKKNALARGAFTSRKSSVSVHAAKAATKKKIGFRWDGANLRWVRDDRFADIAGDDSKTLIKPKTGAAYMV